MPTIEKRVAYLEGVVNATKAAWPGVGSRVGQLDQKVDRFREEVGARIDALDQKVERVRDELNVRIEALDQRVARQFVWLAGIQVSVLVAVIGALLVR